MKIFQQRDVKNAEGAGSAAHEHGVDEAENEDDVPVVKSRPHAASLLRSWKGSRGFCPQKDDRREKSRSEEASSRFIGEKSCAIDDYQSQPSPAAVDSRGAAVVSDVRLSYCGPPPADFFSEGLMNYFTAHSLPVNDAVVAAWDSQLAQTAEIPSLAGMLADRGSEIFPLFAKCYAELSALPRSARRTLQRRLSAARELDTIPPKWRRRLAGSVAGAALLLALGQGTAQAVTLTINVSPKTPPRITADGKCSLIEAIVNANNGNQQYTDCETGGGYTTIVLPPGFQTLRLPFTDYQGDTGLPVILSHITIEGNGARIVRAKGATEFRIFAVGETGNLTLKNTTVSGGIADKGGAIFNYKGALYVQDSTISGNAASDLGGGIYSYAGLVFVDPSTISMNSADSGGGVASRYGKVYLTDTVITRNTADSGGAIYSYYGLTSIDGCTISKNTADRGAGIYAIHGNRTYISDTIITGNKASDRGGGIYQNFNGVYTGLLSIDGSTISKNTAPIGAGVHNRVDSTYISDSTITGNKARETGGGIYNYRAILSIDPSTISGNSARYGGGVENDGGTFTLTNSTITGNKASVRGGGVDNTGGGIFTNNGTVSGNKAPSGYDVAP
jgi:hypothetical protein